MVAMRTWLLSRMLTLFGCALACGEGVRRDAGIGDARRDAAASDARIDSSQSDADRTDVSTGRQDAGRGDGGRRPDGGPSDARPDLAGDGHAPVSTFACGSSTCSSSQYCVHATSEAPPPACSAVPADGICPPGTQEGCAGGQAGCGDIPGSGIAGACRTSSCSDSTICQCLCSAVGNGQCSRNGQVINCFVP